MGSYVAQVKYKLFYDIYPVIKAIPSYYLRLLDPGNYHCRPT